MAAFRQQGRGSFLSAGKAGQGRQDLPRGKVQDYDRRARRPGAAVARRGAAHQGRAVCALHIHRRTSTTLERAQGRHEPHRSAPAACEVFAPIFQGTGSSSRGAPRHHGLGTVSRSQRHFVAEEVRTRRLVRRPHIVPYRLPRDFHNHQKSLRPRRYQLRHLGNNGGFQWQQLIFLVQAATPRLS